MACTKRHFIPGYVWHIAVRCHKREFLLNFPRGRRRWIEWLYQAKRWQFKYSGIRSGSTFLCDPQPAPL